MTRRLHPERVIHDVAEAVALVEGEAGVREVIGLVARLEPVGVRRISRRVELPVPVVAAICGELRKRGVVARTPPVQLTPSGRALFGGVSSATRSWVCASCGGREVVVGEELDHVARELTTIVEAGPPVRFELDQSHCTVSTKLRRVLLLHEAGALEGKRILLLGDDDLMSVAIDRVSRTLGFAGAIDELSVVDVDPAVLAFCRTRLATAPFRVKLFEHDLRNPLPDELTGRFDTIFTDPPYTPTGAEVFLSRAAAALDCLRAGHVFFCFGMKPADATLRVQSAIADMGFVIRRVFKNFNEYYGSGTVAGVSNLYHLTSSSATTPRIGAFHAGPLYTGDEHRARRYRCMTCHAVAIVGHDQVWTTIGGLKSSGCPRCGGPTFRPLPRTSA